MSVVNQRNLTIEDESKLILLNEAKFTMNVRQKNIFKKHKKTVEGKKCEMISTVFIDSKIAKMVIKCKTDPTHALILLPPRSLCIKAKIRESLCIDCNIIEGKRKKLANFMNKNKIANEKKEKERAELTEEEIRLKNIEFFSSDIPLKDKKDRIRILNVYKGTRRMVMCIDEKCENKCGYGFKDVAIHCCQHKLDDEKVISYSPCYLCSTTGSFEYEGKMYCSKHAVERGYRKGKRKWTDAIDEDDNIDDLRKMKYSDQKKNKGDENEKFMTKLLETYLPDAKVNLIGNKSNPMFDIEIAFEDLIWRGIQVKSLTKAENFWTFNTNRHGSKRSKYPDQTLFLVCNDEKSLYIFSRYFQCHISL
jgi:hypothetical protein